MLAYFSPCTNSLSYKLHTFNLMATSHIKKRNGRRGKRNPSETFSFSFLRQTLQSGWRMQKYTLRCITFVTFPVQQRCSFVLAISVPSSAADATIKINFLPFFCDLLTWGIRSQVADSNLMSPKPTRNAAIVLIVFGSSPTPTG